MAQNAQQDSNVAAHRGAGRCIRCIAPTRPMQCLAAITAALVIGVAAQPAQAQGAGNGFLFQEPVGSFALRGGFSRATAGGDLFSQITHDLTLNQSDFSGPTIGADLAFRIAPRFDVVLGSSYAGTSTSSEYRHLEDQNNAAITQTTSLQRVPLTASVRAYLTPRGRSVGRFAWVPAKLAPYVGVGGGAMWYRFRQQGDFVNSDNNNVFSSDLTSSKWTPAGQAMVGLDYSLTPHIGLTGEGKYLWAKAKPDEQVFSGFNSIDLSGLSTTIGLYYRF